MSRHPIITTDLKRIIASVAGWHQLAGSTILVSGAAGFLPAYMVETLLYLNETNTGPPITIVGLVRNLEKARKRFTCYRNRRDLHLIQHDVTRPVALEGDIDYIIHAASQASPKFYGSDPVGTLSANTIGTMNLLKFARKKKSLGFLFFSSGEVYGEVRSDQIPTKETDYGIVDPLNVRSCYAESKRMGENMVVSWHHQYGVPTTIVRPFHTYGPGMKLDDGRVFADFVSDILAGRNIMLQSDGSAVRAFCYLADSTAGFFTVLLQGQPATAYNVGNEGGQTSIIELAELLVKLFPNKGMKVERTENVRPPGYLQSTITRNCPDTTKIRALGWQPVTGLVEGFTKTIRSFEPWG